MPGYSRNVVGQTPFGWSLDEAMEGLEPRLERSRAYWRWRQSASGWDQFQHALLGHLQARVGPGGHYWDASARPAAADRSEPNGPRSRTAPVHGPVHGGHQLPAVPVVKQVLDDPSGYARIELALATTLPSAQAARVFLWLATYPWRAVTWFGPGHSVRSYADRRVRLGRRRGLRCGAAARLARLAVRPRTARPVQLPSAGIQSRWLWVVPILERDRQLAKEHGSASLVSRLASQQRSWIAG